MPSDREVYTLADLRDWARATADANPPWRLAVLGNPVAHSASPPMQNAALAACGIAGRYTRLHIPSADLPAALRLLAPAGFVGCNLTLPHKTAAVPLLDSMDAHAVRLGAVNTVRVEPDGSLRGFNTDGPGFARVVASEFGLPLAGARVVVLGAGGGAGRAVAIQCAMEGCASLALVNRTLEKSRLLAEELSFYPATATTAVPWEISGLRQKFGEIDLIVNTSSLGLKSDDPSPLPADAIPEGVYVFDTVYRQGSVPTPLVAAAIAAGARAVGGHALLLHQGALAFEHWFGRPAPLAVMRRALAAA